MAVLEPEPITAKTSLWGKLTNPKGPGAKGMAALWTIMSIIWGVQAIQSIPEMFGKGAEPPPGPGGEPGMGGGMGNEMNRAMLEEALGSMGQGGISPENLVSLFSQQGGRGPLAPPTSGEMLARYSPYTRMMGRPSTRF